MASSQTNENTTQCITCQCGEGDKNVRKSFESSDKQPQKCPNCQILKSGPLFLSSKGIGWTSWKKRWFILTSTSLIFYRSDPNAPPQKGSEANPTLGGIDLNSSGSVVVKADKKLLTVSFPDGRDGRTFTLKGETSEELQEWKTALENALAQAPSAASAMGQNGIFRNDIADSAEASFEQWKERDKKAVQSLVIGRPVLLALEDADGSPSFLEKALRFIEDHGIKVEGVLRQSADVEEVERREREYEQGKKEFSSNEDAHVIGDCIKHVLREMPSSPVPASCCTALVEAYKIARGNRTNAIRDAISETFPEPNLRLLQRILKMMLTVASHKSENRMSLAALAACMAPLLLRPLLAGECEFEDNFNMGGDGSLQLLKAAAAANHAQAILIIMLEEYESLFDKEFSQDGGSFSSESYTESDEEDIEDDGSTDNGYHDAHHGIQEHSPRSSRSSRSSHSSHSSRGTLSGSGSYIGSDQSDNEDDDHSSDSVSSGASDVKATETPSRTLDASTSQQDIGPTQSPVDIPFSQQAGAHGNCPVQNENSNSAASPNNQSNNSIADAHTSSAMQKSATQTIPGSPTKFRNRRIEPIASVRREATWKHTSGRKNLSMESIDFSTDDEMAVQRLETTKTDLESKIREEVKDNAALQASLEKRMNDLYERRLALEKDVEILREQLQKEMDLKASLESGLNMQCGGLSVTSAMDSKTRADIEEINLAEADIINLNQKVIDLREQLNHNLQPSYPPLCISCHRQLNNNEKNLENNVDSDFLHQNENSSTEVYSSSGASGNVQAQRRVSPSSPHRVASQKTTPEPASQMTASGYSGSSSSEELSTIASSLANGEDVMIKSRTSLPSPKGQPDEQKAYAVNQEKMLLLEHVSISSNEMPSSVLKDAALNNSTSRGEDSKSGAGREDRLPQNKDTLPFTGRKLSYKVRRGDEAMPIASDSSKKSSSNDENPKSGVDTNTDKGKAQNQNSSTLADAQPSQRLPRQTTYKSRTKPNEPSSNEEGGTLTRNFASKRSSFRVDDVTKESQDSPSLPSRQLSKQQSSAANDTPTIGRHTASKKYFRSEDAAPSSASSSNALSRLTNRLNFLKERRVQLANELQNLEAKPEGTPL